MRPAAQILLSFALAFAGLGAVIVACSPAPGQLPALIRCQLEALKVLPADVGMITVYDGVDIWERVHRCKERHPAPPPSGTSSNDAGLP